MDTSTPSISNDIRFGESLKKQYPEAFILLVGTHPSSTVEETLNYGTLIDGIARKEYDYTVSILARALQDSTSLYTVPGLTFRQEGAILHNADAEYISDLDDIPFASQFIKKHLSEMDYFFAAAHYPAIQIFIGRGVSSKCTFCVYPQTMHGHKYRLVSPQNVVSEFEYIAEHFPSVKEVIIEDDTFTANKQRVLDICQLLIAKGCRND